MFRVLVFAALALFGSVVSHSYHLGACPVVEPMPEFNMNQMLGVWYVIQKTSTASHCITYNFSRTDEPGTYSLQQVSQHFLLGLTPLEHDYKYTGVLTVPDPAVPGRMRVRFPLSVAGSASYTVMSTDYSTYAAVFTCQKLAFAHRRSATILSRTKELDRIYIDKMRSKLASYGVDPYDLSIISQSECPKHDNSSGVNINIQPDTFSTHNIGEAVRKTGVVIARDHLERIIINNKGSIEKSKKKLDKICTLRTLIPEYFEKYDFSECYTNVYMNVLLPQLTPDHHRVYIMKINGSDFTQDMFHRVFKLIIVVIDYLQAIDYSFGVTHVVDFMDASVVDYILKVNLVELRKLTAIYMEGYSMRIKNIHIMTESKSIQALITLLKQVLSAKLVSRICVHNKTDTLYKYIPKDMLPVEYGGKGASMQQLCDNLIKELSSEEFIQCRNEMNKCRTNEAYRQADKYNDEYMGMAGTFRNLHVD